MLFKLILTKNDGTKSYDITPIVGTITWDSNLSLMSVMDFDLLWSDMPALFPVNPCDLGDIVMLYSGSEEVYRGVIVTEGRAGRESIKYTVYDYAFYLGESKSIYQFNKISASNAITRILTDFGMLIGKIAPMNSIVDELYLEKSPAEIIDDIYKREEKKTGKRFNVEMRKGKIYFEDMKDLLIKGTFRQADNLPRLDVMNTPLGADRSRTISTMRNRVKIIIDKGKSQYVVAAMVQDKALISKYGLLEEVYKIDLEDEAKARESARILLQRLGRIHETNSISLVGDVAFKAGRLLDVTEPTTKMKGRYMITAVKHTVVNQNHVMDLDLALPEEVR